MRGRVCVRGSVCERECVKGSVKEKECVRRARGV